MKSKYSITIGMIIISLVVAACGVSQEEYDQISNELETAKEQLASLQTELESTNDQLALAQSELDTAKDQLASAQNELETAQTSLEETQKICPPGSFESVTELENWVGENLIESEDYADGTFRNVLDVQNAGLEEGYLISIDLDYYSDREGWAILLGAFAGNSYYSWTPEKDFYDGVYDSGFVK